jgi:Membrane carboxypeptidase (penicillin-binding protein)
MLRPRLKTILFRFTILLTLVIIAGLGIASYSFFTLEKEMTAKLESKKFLSPTEYFAAPPTFTAKATMTRTQVEEILLRQHYRKREFDQRLLPGDYFVANSTDCASRMQIGLDENQTECIAWVNHEVTTDKADSSIQALVFQNDGTISKSVKGAPFQDIAEVNLESPLVAQYVGTEPLMQTVVSLGQVPTACLNAIMSIEDAQFLEHGGISIKSIGRAVLKNLTSRRAAQGGSTITQQLVKNYFLTSEKSLKRKYQEFFISLLLESRFSKDEILEMYLNIIYMGQSGAFQLRGYGSASQFYFAKDITDLSLPECALMAAMVNSPGAFSPFRNPANAIKRRALVLEKMSGLGYITEDEQKTANEAALPTKVPVLASETAPYYLDAVRKQLSALNIPLEGTRIYTGLRLEDQQAAQESLRNYLTNIETTNKVLKAQKEKGALLEGVVLSADNRTGLVNVVVGGRNYRMTQFNRALDGHRQVGSIMKPFVYLTALLNKTPEDQPYTPMTLLNDEKFTTKYEGQSWSPNNYGKKYFGTVPMFFALKNSLNAATASLGLAVGLGNIIDVAHEIGVDSALKPVPSVTLGAFEMYPKEVLQSYMTFANMGQRKDLTYVTKVIAADGKVAYEHVVSPRSTVDAAAVGTLVGMMKQTVLSGTARSITLNGFMNPAAGKTGTTSDNKDAWFAGFTPYLTTVVWIGFDNNLNHKLTGASGPVPVWTAFMKKASARYPADDFTWPEDTSVVDIDEDDLRAVNAIQNPDDPLGIQLIFKKGTEP